MTKVRVWLSHDGYRDPDDNLAQLVGSVKARDKAKKDSDVSVAGLIFGDTTDGGQYHMVYPSRNTPSNMDGDPRFDNIAKNKVAAGNYEFFKKYGKPAIEQLAPGWSVIDTVQGEVNASWNYDARSYSGLSYAARELTSDIRAAIRKGGGDNPNEVVVYSAGGGAHVPAEAIAYLRNIGIGDAKIKQHFAIVQHGRSNFALNLENEARNITRTFTIPISKQDLDRYANGMDGPGLGDLVRGGIYLDGSRYGPKMALALDVVQGQKPFQNLGGNKTFKPTQDGSDSGSHAFAVADNRLMQSWDMRLRPGETLSTEVGREHQIVEADGGYRLRVIYNSFDWQDARQLMNSRSSSASASAEDETAPVAAATASAEEGDGAGEGATKVSAPVSTEASTDAGTEADAGPEAVRSLSLGEADVFAFDIDGNATDAVSQNGRIGVAGQGKANDIERAEGKSEKLLVDLGENTDAVAIILAGLSKRGGAQEAAEITVYDDNGAVVDTQIVTKNGRTTLSFGEDVRWAAIEAAEWQGGNAPAANPDLSLVWIEAL